MLFEKSDDVLVKKHRRVQPYPGLIITCRHRRKLSNAGIYDYICNKHGMKATRAFMQEYCNICEFQVEAKSK